MDVETHSAALDPNVNVHITGWNGALRRPPKIETLDVELFSKPGFVPSWKPYFPKPKTFGFAFPDAVEFLKPPEPKPEELQSIEVETRKPAKSESSAPRKSTFSFCMTKLKMSPPRLQTQHFQLCRLGLTCGALPLLHTEGASDSQSSAKHDQCD